MYKIERGCASRRELSTTIVKIVDLVEDQRESISPVQSRVVWPGLQSQLCTLLVAASNLLH